MHIKKTYAMAAAALMAALSVVLLLIGVYIPVNTLFFYCDGRVSGRLYDQ